MDDMTEFERQLSGGFKGLMGPSEPVDDAAIFNTIAATQSPKWRFGSMFSATKFLIAGAVVALFGGFLLSGVLTPDGKETAPIVGASASARPDATVEATNAVSTTPEATITRSIELPTKIPKRFDSGTLDTPLGKARWVHLSGDGEELPEAITPIAVPGGYVSLDRGGDNSGATLWFSPDLLKWTQRPLPDDAEIAQLIRAGGSYWLLMSADRPAEDGSFDPTLWRSTDALAWEPVDFGPIAPDGPDGLGWGPSFGVVTSAGDTDAVAMTFHATTAGSFLGITTTEDARQWVSLIALGENRYQAFGDDGEERVVIRFEPTDEGLRVIDDETGAELKELAGVDMDFIERWSQNGESLPAEDAWYHIPLEHRVGVVVDGELTSIELPAVGPSHPSGLRLVGSDEGFSAFLLRPDGLLQSWRSRDGLTWTAGEQFGDDPDGPSDVVSLSEGPEGLLAQGPTKRMLWSTTDGVDWQLAEPFPKGNHGGRIGPGYLMLRRQALEFHPDGGGKVRQVDAKPLRLKLTTKGSSRYAQDAISPNTFRYAVSEWVGSRWQRDQWIITFDDLP